MWTILQTLTERPTPDPTKRTEAEAAIIGWGGPFRSCEIRKALLEVDLAQLLAFSAFHDS
jgi:hypothetical protein